MFVFNNPAGGNQASMDSFKRYFLPRVKVENCNIKIDERNFHDQPINYSIKQDDEIRKISTGQGDRLFWKKIQTNCCWFKQKKALDADSRAIQHINFTGETKSTVPYKIIYYILEQSKETILETAKRTTKVL